MKILFNYTTRGRREHFKRGLKSIIDNCESTDYRVLVFIDKDDEKMNNAATWIDIANTPRVDMVAGLSLNKVDAINRDVNELVYNWDIIVNVSDDMEFIKKGFDNDIRAVFDKSLDWCVHVPDGNRNDLITLAILGRDYYKRFNYIYHPDYKSLWCDNEMTEVAKRNGRYIYLNKQIVEHLHPAYGKAHMDNQYRHTESFNGVDSQTFNRRRTLNFPV